MNLRTWTIPIVAVIAMMALHVNADASTRPAERGYGDASTDEPAALAPEHLAYLRLMEKIDAIAADSGSEESIDFIRWHLLISEARAERFLTTVRDSVDDIDRSKIGEHYRHALMSIGSDAAARLHLWVRDVQHGSGDADGLAMGSVQTDAIASAGCPCAYNR